MTVPLDQDVLEQLARAVFGQLSPLGGTRATGSVLVVNDTADAIVVPPNMYLLPNVGSLGELADDLVFKTTRNPATAAAHGQGGDWTIPANDSLEIGIQSNLGGARHNLPAGTVFRWDPPLDVLGLGPTCELVADMTDGANKLAGPAINSATYYEDLDSSRVADDAARGRLSAHPGVFICWEASTPVEGRTSSTNRGSTRANSEQTFFAENYRLYVVSSDVSSDALRRGAGLLLLQAITRLLTDQQQTTDGEQLTTLGSLEITGRSRFTRNERTYVYQLAYRINRTYTRVDARTFLPWLHTHIVASAPGRAAPEPTAPIVIADVEQDMPHT